MKRYHLHYLPDGRVELSQSGVDHGPRRPELVHRTEHYAVVKYHGSTSWVGCGQQTYYGTRYELFLVTWGGTCQKPPPYFDVIKTVREVKPGARWKAGVAELRASTRALEDSGYHLEVEREQAERETFKRLQGEAQEERQRKLKAAVALARDRMHKVLGTDVQCDVTHNVAGIEVATIPLEILAKLLQRAEMPQAVDTEPRQLGLDARDVKPGELVLAVCLDPKFGDDWHYVTRSRADLHPLDRWQGDQCPACGGPFDAVNEPCDWLISEDLQEVVCTCGARHRIVQKPEAEVIF